MKVLLVSDLVFTRAKLIDTEPENSWDAWPSGRRFPGGTPPLWRRGAERHGSWSQRSGNTGLIHWWRGSTERQKTNQAWSEDRPSRKQRGSAVEETSLICLPFFPVSCGVSYGEEPTSAKILLNSHQNSLEDVFLELPEQCIHSGRS